MFVALFACVAKPDPTLPPSMQATAPPQAADPPPVSREIAGLTLVATGDVLLHKAVQEAAAHKGSYEALLAGTRELISGADIAFLNLETPVAPKTGAPVSTGKQPAFNAPLEALSAIAATGFDVISFANNHVYDQGRPGFIETLDHLDASGLAYVGAGRTCADAASPKILEAGGLKVAFLGTSQIYNDRLNEGPEAPCADAFDEARLLAAVRAVRPGVDAVVLSIHWGVEYQTSPTEAQIEAAHALAEAGVDVLLGHHPHVLAPIEVFHPSDGRVAVIAYSLGNYVSNQSAWYEPGLNPPEAALPRDGVVLKLRIARREYGMPSGKTVARIDLADLLAEPLWTLNDATTRAEGAPPAIGVELLDARMASLRERLASATGEGEIVALSSEIDELSRRRKQVRRILGEQFLRYP